MLSNLADTTIPDRSLVHLLDRTGKLQLFETHQLMNAKGLRCIAYTSFNKEVKKPEMKVVFLGTTDISSGLLDIYKPKVLAPDPLLKKKKNLSTEWPF